MSGMETAMGMANNYSQAQAQARAAQQQADYQRQMAEYNARIAEQEADIERRLGEKRQRAITQQGEGQAGMLRSRIGQSGISLLDPDSSVADVLGQVASDYEAEAEADRWSTENTVTRLRHKAQTYQRHAGGAGGLLRRPRGAPAGHERPEQRPHGADQADLVLLQVVRAFTHSAP